jgi:hypothetical protein
MAALRGERRACVRGGRSVDAQNNRRKWRVSACFRSNSDVPQKMMAMRHHALKKVQRLYKNIKLYNFSQNL